jgi:hypothetical protein
VPAPDKIQYDTLSDNEYKCTYLRRGRVERRTLPPSSLVVSADLRFPLAFGVFEAFADAGGVATFKDEEAMAPVLVKPEAGVADVGGAGAECGGFGTGLGFGLGRETPWGWEDDVVEVVIEVGPSAGAGAGAEAGLDGALRELVDDLLDWSRATPTEDDVLVDEPFVLLEDVDTAATGGSLPAVLEAFEVFGKAGLCAADANNRLVRKLSATVLLGMLTSQSSLFGGCRRRYR